MKKNVSASNEFAYVNLNQAQVSVIRDRNLSTFLTRDMPNV